MTLIGTLRRQSEHAKVIKASNFSSTATYLKRKRIKRNILPGESCYSMLSI